MTPILWATEHWKTLQNIDWKFKIKCIKGKWEKLQCLTWLQFWRKGSNWPASQHSSVEQQETWYLSVSGNKSTKVVILSWQFIVGSLMTIQTVNKLKYGVFQKNMSNPSHNKQGFVFKILWTQLCYSLSICSVKPWVHLSGVQWRQ